MFGRKKKENIVLNAKEAHCIAMKSGDDKYKKRLIKVNSNTDKLISAIDKKILLQANKGKFMVTIYVPDIVDSSNVNFEKVLTTFKERGFFFDQPTTCDTLVITWADLRQKEVLY